MVDELFDVVDEADNVVGVCTRGQAHSNPELIHRSVMFFLFDSGGRVFVSRRSMNKEFFPGHYSIVLGGHVGHGESYDAAVRREALEEANADSTPFYLGSFRKYLSCERENVRVYGFIMDCEPILLRQEIDSGAFMDLGELEVFMGENDFIPETPQLIDILREYLMKDGPGKS
jgi:8-oxo-dGTP pyrophosphatase MutT (NUDIX family)